MAFSYCVSKRFTLNAKRYSKVAKNKQQKKEVLEKVEKAVKGAKSVVFVNFHGMTVAEVTELRKKLRTEKVGYMVAKKTIAKKAIEGAKIATGTMPELAGEFAFAYGEDQIAPAREVYAFQKKFDKKLSILGGIFEAKFVDKAAMMEIATIPGLQTLYGMFANVINSPIQGLVMALNEISKKKTS